MSETPLTKEQVVKMRKFNDRELICYCPLCLAAASIMSIIEPWLEPFFPQRLVYSVGAMVKDIEQHNENEEQHDFTTNNQYCQLQSNEITQNEYPIQKQNTFNKYDEYFVENVDV
jgi:hypothetical protein